MPQSGFEEGLTVSDTGSLDVWVKEIFAKVPGAVEGYIYDQLKLVIKDFFQRSTAWRAISGPFTIPANVGTYKLSPFDGQSSVIQVLAVYRNGVPLGPAGQTKMFEGLSDNVNTPNKYYTDPYDNIVLSPTNSAEMDSMYADVVLTPRLLSDNRIAQWIIDIHYEAILAGTLQRLYSEPGKIYTNELKSEYWGKKYRSELVRARSKAQSNYKRGPKPWAFPSWNR